MNRKKTLDRITYFVNILVALPVFGLIGCGVFGLVYAIAVPCRNPPTWAAWFFPIALDLLLTGLWGWYQYRLIFLRTPRPPHETRRTLVILAVVCVAIAFVLFFGLACRLKAERMSEAREKRKIAAIAEDPEEAFHELTKLQKHISFACDGEHADMAKFDANRRDSEILRFLENFDGNAVPADGYLSSGARIAENEGIFRIFREANRRKRKTRPGLRRPDGFVREYSRLVLAVLKMELFSQYEIVDLIGKGREDEAISLLCDLAEAEWLLRIPTARTVRFMDVLLKKYDFSARNRNRVMKARHKLREEIGRITGIVMGKETER